MQESHCAVYDNVLDKETFNKCWEAISHEEFSIPHIANWTKVWRLTDGLCQGGKFYDSREGPYNNYMDVFKNCFLQFASVHADMIGEYSHIALRAYLYPRDTKLNWHNDAGYKAAMIFYVHPYWASTWGGELMIAKTPYIDLASVPQPCLDHTFEDEFLAHAGMGQYITAKPNRIVITKAGIWHSINRVDKDAGDHVRSSIVGFFMP